jgi:hypothetical protein
MTVDAFNRAWSLLKTKGINVNDSHAPYTDMILDGRKTIETRRSRSLDSYIGDKVGLIRTGKGDAKLVGYVTLGQPKEYDNYDEFNRDRKQHRVPKGSPEDKRGHSFGYPIRSKKKVQPREIHSRGIISREI